MAQGFVAGPGRVGSCILEERLGHGALIARLRSRCSCLTASMSHSNDAIWSLIRNSDSDRASRVRYTWGL
jgi:hypothetical protein